MGKDAKKGRKVLNPRLALGEVTGHSHTVDGPAMIEGKDGEVTSMSVSAKTTVRHEEHKPVEIRRGDHSVERVQEYDHFAEEAKKVQD